MKPQCSNCPTFERTGTSTFGTCILFPERVAKEATELCGQHPDFQNDTSKTPQEKKLSTKTANALAKAEITLQQAKNMTDAQLLANRGIGTKAIKEIRT